MEADELSARAVDMVTGLKASGMSMGEIVSYLFFCLAAVMADPDTSDATVDVLATMIGTRQ